MKRADWLDAGRPPESARRVHDQGVTSAKPSLLRERRPSAPIQSPPYPTGYASIEREILRYAPWRPCLLGLRPIKLSADCSDLPSGSPCSTWNILETICLFKSNIIGLTRRFTRKSPTAVQSPLQSLDQGAMRLVPNSQIATPARLTCRAVPDHFSTAHSPGRKAMPKQGRGVVGASSTCVAWQAARAARARAIAAWASDLLALRSCGVTSDQVSFAGFASGSPIDAVASAD